MKWESIGQVGVWQRIDADIILFILHQVSVSLFNTRLIFLSLAVSLTLILVLSVLLQI